MGDNGRGAEELLRGRLLWPGAMSLFLVATADPAFAADAERQAREEFARQGVAHVAAIDLDGWRLLHAGPILGGPDTLLIDGDDLVAVAGMPVVDGLIGRPALQRLLAAGPLPDPAWRRVGGQFVALVRRGGRIHLFGDHLGSFQCFHDTGERVFSTSLLAALGALPRVSFDTQGLYEWAFGVTTIGHDTVFEELKLLGPERVVELTAGGAVSHPVATPLVPTPADHIPVEERLAANAARLMGVADALVRGFGDDIHCPLSGGFDSRLILAALRAAGCTPKVYVYGPAGGTDVRLAQAMGAAEGFPVEWVDKQAAAIAPDAFAAQVERNFHELDGLPNFGNLFDNGMNAAARDRRHAGGSLAVSGGGGEIYRDYYMLPDRPASAMTMARCFNRRFVASDATDLLDPDAYLNRIADKVAAALGSDDRHATMPRLAAEQGLVRIKLPILFRWEAAAEARFGPYTLPFMDPAVAEEAAPLPMPVRWNGAFEAAMIRTLDPGLARHMSAYGHALSGQPGWRHRLDQWGNRHRPVWLRERGYRLRRMRPMADEHGGLLSPDYLGRVVDADLPIMRRFFHVDRINDSGLWRRIACLEYLAERLGSRLAA
jgi:asparagine synthase (glutamine-hydrolysing)